MVRVDYSATDIYWRISEQCKLMNITPGTMCSDLGMRNGQMSDMKSGKIKTISVEHLARYAQYLHVSLDYLVYGEEHGSLTDDEAKLLNAWRNCSSDEQENVAFILRNYGVELPKKKKQSQKAG